MSATTVAHRPDRAATPSATAAASDSHRSHAYLALPAIILLGMLFVLPMVRMTMVSFGLPTELSLATYREAVSTPAYVRVLVTTFNIAGTSALLALGVGYPLAYILTTSPRWVVTICLMAMIVPFVTSILVRMFGWVVILSPTGILPAVLRTLGLGDVPLLYNRVGVVTGIVYALLPYSVFTLRAAILQIDRNLILAARSLGANNWNVFTKIYLPLTMRGIAASLLLTFVMATGYFMAPRLMGGTGDQTIASVIENAIDVTFSERIAATLGVILLMFVLAVLALVYRVVGVKVLDVVPR